VNKNELDVSISDNTLSIRGTLSAGNEEEVENYFVQECYWGEFSRTVALPVAVKEDEASAALKDGVLTISFPKVQQEQAKKTFELYKQYNVNPFSGCLLILVQLPFIFALYCVFLKGTGFNEWALYSFVHYPAVINTMFLGLIDLHGKSIVLAVLAGISQFFQIWLVTKSQKTKKLDDKSTFKDQLAHSMAIQTKYILPIFIVFIAYKVSSAGRPFAGRYRYPRIATVPKRTITANPIFPKNHCIKSLLKTLAYHNSNHDLCIDIYTYLYSIFQLNLER
jgi:hypothetical protein